MKKLGLLLFCFVLLLSGCKLTQSEEVERKEKYATNGMQPKNLDEKLFDMGFRVENEGKKGLTEQIRDRWDIIHINQKEQAEWKGFKIVTNLYNSAGDFIDRAYLYQDDMQKMLIGRGDNFVEWFDDFESGSIVGVGLKGGTANWLKGFSTAKEFSKFSNSVTAYKTMKNLNSSREYLETVDKVFKTYKLTADVMKFDNAHEMFAMKTMNVFNHAIMKKKEEGLELYEWAFIERPYQEQKLTDTKAEYIPYPMDSEEDTFLGGKEKENPTRISRKGDRLRFFNGENLPTYKGIPKIDLTTDNSKEEGLKTKKKVQQVLYDIHQVLQGKPTAYYGEYAYHLVEDYAHNKRNFETNFYAMTGMVALEANNMIEAEELFDKTLEMKKNHIPALLGKAKIYLMQIQTDKAMDIYRKVLKDQLDEKTAKELNVKSLSTFFVKNPNDYILIDIMQTFYELEKDKEMVEFFEENAKQKTHAAVSFYYAQSLFRLGKCEEALQYLAKAKSEIPDSIPHDNDKNYTAKMMEQIREANKKYMVKIVEKTEEDWKNKGCGKRESDADFSEWYITFEIDPKTKKAKLGIPEGGHVLNVKKGNTIKMVEKNKDPKHITKVVFTGPALDAINPKGKSQSEIEKDGEFTALAKDKGTGLISILPDGDWGKEHKIVVFIN